MALISRSSPLALQLLVQQRHLMSSVERLPVVPWTDSSCTSNSISGPLKRTTKRGTRGKDHSKKNNMMDSFLPNSRALLPTFRTNCPDGVSFCPDGVSFCPNFHPQPLFLLRNHTPLRNIKRTQTPLFKNSPPPPPPLPSPAPARAGSRPPASCSVLENALRVVRESCNVNAAVRERQHKCDGVNAAT